MRIEKDIFTILLDYMCVTEHDPSFMVIGAMDGISYDCFTPYLRIQKWSGVFVEPVPEQFRRLRINIDIICKEHNHKFINAAIAEHDGYVKMLTIDQEAVDSGKVHPCFGGMSAIYPPRNGLSSVGDAPVVERYGKYIEVECFTLGTIINKYSIQGIDIFCVDAEGWDYKILRQLNFEVWRPKLIRCEYINLNNEEKSQIIDLFSSKDYVYQISDADINATPLELWKIIINKGNGWTPNRDHKQNRLPDITFVTSVMDPNHIELEKKFDTVHGVFGFLDDLGKSGLNIFIYGDRFSTEMKIASYYHSNIHLFHKNITDLMSQPVSERLMKNADKKNLPQFKSAQGKAAGVLDISSIFLLNDATIYNPFDNKYFIFVDFWCLINNLEAISAARRIGDVSINCMVEDVGLFISSEEPNNDSINNLIDVSQCWLGFEPSLLKHISTCNIIGGNVSAINIMNAHYYSCLSFLLERNIVCDAASVMTVLTHSHQHLCSKYKCV